MTTAELIARSRAIAQFRSYPEFSGSDYETTDCGRRLAFFRDFRRFIPFAKRQELVALVRRSYESFGEGSL